MAFRTRITSADERESHAIDFAVARARAPLLLRAEYSLNCSSGCLSDSTNHSTRIATASHATHRPCTKVGRVADRTGCTRKESYKNGAVTESTRQVQSKAPDGEEKVDSTRLLHYEYESQTTMASSTARHLSAPQALRNDEELRINFRAATRIQMAPEKDGGRATLQR
eukprot:4130563-Pleurochrysis_carterae.AAC.1